MATLVDPGTLVVVTRTIVVTPEPPESGLDLGAVTLSIGVDLTGALSGHLPGVPTPLDLGAVGLAIDVQFDGALSGFLPGVPLNLGAVTLPIEVDLSGALSGYLPIPVDLGAVTLDIEVDLTGTLSGYLPVPLDLGAVGLAIDVQVASAVLTGVPVPLDLGAVALSVPVVFAGVVSGYLPGNATPLDLGPVTLSIPVVFTGTLSGGLAVTVAAVPAADVLADVLAPVTVTATVSPLSPPDGSVVPTVRPTFTATVSTTDDTAVLQVQYDTDPAFASAVLISGEVTAGLVEAPASATASVDLADESVYYWRARVSNPYGVGVWSQAFTLAVNTPDGTAVAMIGWSVQTGLVAAPHLWLLHPDSGADTGLSASAVGTGFGSAPEVFVGDLACTAGPGAPRTPDAGDPLIDVVTGVVTVYAEQVSFTIPELGDDSPGDAVTVQRS